MFTGTKENSSVNYLKTGLSSFQFLGCNPSASQIEEWTGRENVADPNYDIQDDYSRENQIRPLNLYFKNDDDVVVNFRIDIGNNPDIKKSGNYQVCTSTGSVVWAKASGSATPKPEFVDHKPLVIGEATLIEFISKFINFDTRSGENLYQQLVEQKLDAASLYSGDFSGMANLAKWGTEKNKRITMLLMVKEKPGVDNNGNPVTKRYQVVSSEPQTWFHGDVTDWAEGKLRERYEKSLQVGPGQTQAYPLVKDMFTIKYQSFVKEDCLNSVPDNPTVTTGGWN